MDAKIYLSQLSVQQKTIDQDRDRIFELKTGYFSCKAPDHDNVISGCTSDKVGDTAVRIKLLTDQLDLKISYYIDLWAEITYKIDQLTDPLYRIILTARYILHKSWSRISQDLCFSVQQCYRIHSSALQEFNRAYMEYI